jgi:hypothetical protein
MNMKLLLFLSLNNPLWRALLSRACEEKGDKAIVYGYSDRYCGKSNKLENEPHYPKAGNGTQLMSMERTLCIYFMRVASTWRIRSLRVPLLAAHTPANFRLLSRQLLGNDALQYPAPMIDFRIVRRDVVLAPVEASLHSSGHVASNRGVLDVCGCQQIMSYWQPMMS